MKISIVTPSYNQGQYIERAIQSVLSQGYDNFEHIIYDACSTDNTLEILKKYPHLIWISEPDNGQSHALNKGFRKVSGDVIGWLNTDEFYYQGTFKKVKELYDQGRFDILYGDYIEVRGGSRRVIQSVPHLPGLLNWHHYINTLTVFMKIDIFDKGFFIDESYDAAMDKEFFLRLEQSKFRFKYVSHIFGEFLWHDDNKSTLIRQRQVRESFDIITRYFFYGNRSLAKILFWPVKLLYAVIYRLAKLINRSSRSE